MITKINFDLRKIYRFYNKSYIMNRINNRDNTTTELFYRNFVSLQFQEILITGLNYHFKVSKSISWLKLHFSFIKRQPTELEIIVTWQAGNSTYSNIFRIQI